MTLFDISRQAQNEEKDYFPENATTKDSFNFFVDNSEEIENNGEIKEYYFIHCENMTKSQAKIIKGVFIPNSIILKNGIEFCTMQYNCVSYNGIRTKFVGTDKEEIANNFVEYMKEKFQENILIPLSTQIL